MEVAVKAGKLSSEDARSGIDQLSLTLHHILNEQVYIRHVIVD